MASEDGVRLDQWLWAARFFKTRALAGAAISGGKVEVNGARAKCAKLLRSGDRVRVRRGADLFIVRVTGVSRQRRGAAEAAQLYEEDAAGREARERLALQLRIAPAGRYEGKGRPTKRERRELERLRDPAPE